MRSTRRRLVPEVVQTSAMDCGPAALHALLRGHGLPSGYGRLREACQTDVDGTSIDTLEDVANLLGLEAEQILLPPDWLALPAADALPAIVVLRLANGLTHFAVVWRRHGPLLQLMDPATGRRWLRVDELRRELFAHSMAVPAAAWLEWAAGDEARAALAARIGVLGVKDARARVERAASGGTWEPLARLDAAARLVAHLVRSHAVRRGREASRLFTDLIQRDEAGGAGSAIPDAYWCAAGAGEDPGEGPMLRVTGAVLVRIRGVREERDPEALRALPELAAAAAEPEPRPIRALLRMLKEESPGGRWAVAVSTVIGPAAMVVEVVLLRALLEIGTRLGLRADRVAAVLVLAVFLLGILGIEWGKHLHVIRLGRRLESALRRRFGEKIPRLADHYMRSRPVSDMAKRCHDLHEVRAVPMLLARLATVLAAVCVFVAGIIWVAPAQWPWALVAGATAIALPLAFRPALEERDLRVRTHAGALGQSYLDAVFAHAAIRAHGAGENFEREHEALLTDWARASWQRAHSVIALTISQMALGIALAGLILYRHTQLGAAPAGILLLAYFATALPSLGEELAYLLRRIPAARNTVLRLLEPLAAPELDDAGPAATTTPDSTHRRPRGGTRIELRGVRVVAGGHEILRDVDLAIEPCEHVAVVGRSGAGKSTLVGLLLGWHRATAGEVRIDGERLTAGMLARIRDECAWVDPAVHLWNRTLFDNLRYGRPDGTLRGLPLAIERASLIEVLERLDRGLATRLGESGRRLSGGEGQRVRLARGLLRAGARLVLLDEPFRGLERDRRVRLLAAAREHWAGATLLVVTHDVADTLDMPRVLVVEDGRVIEDGDPRGLLAARGRYAALVEEERAVRTSVWGGAQWRRLVLAGGALAERGGTA